jgi:phosphoadenosine phosphosulfate reductase
MRSVVQTQYGEKAGDIVPFDKVVLLSKTPSIDHLDDIIVDGRSIGSLGFDLFGMKWAFRPRAEGARRIGTKADKKFIRVNSSARRFVLRGRDVFSSNIVEIGPDVSKGEHVLIYSSSGDEVLGVGKVMKDLKEGTSAVAIRVTSSVKGSNAPRANSNDTNQDSRKGGQTWNDVIKSNDATLIRKEAKARRFMERVAREKGDLPKAISFSGGKDSLAMLLLSRDAVDCPAVFVDTGLELPETVKHTHEIVPKLGFDLIEETAGEIFWNSLDVFGPPSRDYRWCCKTSKLSPIVKLTKGRFPKGCLMFVGQRQYESLTRAKRPDIWVNPWIPVNIEASPINEWTALHVWLYLMKQKINPNPLYFDGMDRIGCWLCPACEMAEFKIVQKKHPELWSRWESYLQAWGKRIGYDERWVTHGLWRWRRYPGQIQSFISTQRINVSPKHTSDEKKTMTLSLVSGVRPCGRTGVSIEGAFSRSPYSEKISNILNSVGIVRMTKGVIRIWSKDNDIYLFNDGRITINSSNEKIARQQALKLTMAAARVERCIKCGSCISICPSASITLGEDYPFIDEAKCSHCGLCTKVCPVAHFGTVEENRSTIFSNEAS